MAEIQSLPPTLLPPKLESRRVSYDEINSESIIYLPRDETTQLPKVDYPFPFKGSVSHLIVDKKLHICDEIDFSRVSSRKKTGTDYSGEELKIFAARLGFKKLGKKGDVADMLRRYCGKN